MRRDHFETASRYIHEKLEKTGLCGGVADSAAPGSAGVSPASSSSRAARACRRDAGAPREARSISSHALSWEWRSINGEIQFFATSTPRFSGRHDENLHTLGSAVPGRDIGWAEGHDVAPAGSPRCVRAHRGRLSPRLPLPFRSGVQVVGETVEPVPNRANAAAMNAYTVAIVRPRRLTGRDGDEAYTRASRQCRTPETAALKLPGSNPMEMAIRYPENDRPANRGVADVAPRPTSAAWLESGSPPLSYVASGQ